MNVVEADGVRLFRNPRVAARATPYGGARERILNDAGFAAAEREIRGWPDYAETPLRSLPALAARLGVASLHYKDEGGRFGLGSFKALGGAYAVFRILKSSIEARCADRQVASADIIAGRYREIAEKVTVTCATDGNHGRSVAWGAKLFGCRCVIYIHETVSEGRRAAIARYGADVVRVAGNYDDSVRHAAEQADRNGWTVVSDTTYEGYREIPVDVMHGYGVMSREIVRQMSRDPPTHVFVQAGVGGLAASVCAAFWIAWEARRPALVVVEPTGAACHFESGRAGRPVVVTGSLDTVMAGLACGEVSPLAWEIVDGGAAAYAVVDDRFAIDAMRALARPNGGDPPIVAGETGGCGLALMLAIDGHRELRDALGLDRASRVLLIGSEGATDPEIYRRIVGHTESTVPAGAAGPSQSARPLGGEARSAVRGEHASTAALRIDGERLLSRLARLAEIGPIDGGGSCRLALTDDDKAGRDLVVGWMRELGLDVSVDRVGNVFGLRRGTESLPPVMTGSHIDTVRTGGRYDGNLGVLGGLEVVETLDAAGIATRRPLVVAIFTNEEGARFAPDMLGSLVYAGGLPLADALAATSIDGKVLGDELARIGYAGDAPLGIHRPHAYVELHIEQGPVLDAEGITIGAVEDLQGISWQEVAINGQSNHAGTTPMRLRHDAGYSAAAIAHFLRGLAREMGGAQVCTVGRIELVPNLINVIAARATLTVDLRNTDEALLKEAEARLDAFLETLRRDEGVTIRTKRLARFEPVIFDPAVIRCIEGVAARLGFHARRMTSGAGHDAQMLARVCPAAMIFVPSVKGISHNAAEHTEPADLVAGANVLLHTLLELASGEAG